MSTYKLLQQFSADTWAIIKENTNGTRTT